MNEKNVKAFFALVVKAKTEVHIAHELIPRYYNENLTELKPIIEAAYEKTHASIVLARNAYDSLFTGFPDMLILHRDQGKVVSHMKQVEIAFDELFDAFLDFMVKFETDSDKEEQLRLISCMNASITAIFDFLYHFIYVPSYWETEALKN